MNRHNEPGLQSRSTELLASPGFLLAVSLLILNDTWLKSQVSSWWTGKLSDVAGLYALPILLTALFPRARRSLFILTGLAFLCWKSPLSSSSLQAWNHLGLWPLTRVIDYTDWVALLSLPLAYHATTDGETRRGPSPFRRLRALSAGLLAVLAFSATSRAAPRFTMAPANGFFVAGPRARVINDLLATGLRRTSAPYDQPSDHGPDTLSYAFVPTSGAWIFVTLELRQAGCGALLTPLSFQTIRKHPDAAMVADSVYHQLVQPLQERFSDCPSNPGQ